MKRVLWIVIGFCCGLLSVIFLLVVGWFFLGSYLVVETTPTKADAIVVLGGDDGNRLKKAVALHEKADSRPIILVDEKKSSWGHIAKDLCDKGVYEGTPVTCLVGSTNTVTDADLTRAYCKEHGLRKILVVTDPYHSRRAKIIFSKIFKGAGLEPLVVHSGYYGNKLPPEQGWWKDPETAQAVWIEFGKILFFLANGAGYRMPGESVSR